MNDGGDCSIDVGTLALQLQNPSGGDAEDGYCTAVDSHQNSDLAVSEGEPSSA